MKAYQQELVNEYVALKKRELNLFNYLIKRELGIIKTPLTCPVNVIRKQYEALNVYTTALFVRLECEGIDTNKIVID